MHKFISYIKFLLKSTNQHGVHSPFVYGLVTQCFYDKNPYPEYAWLPFKKQRLVFRCTRYFDVENVVVQEEGKVYRKAIENANPKAVVSDIGKIPEKTQLVFLGSIPEPSLFQKLMAPLGNEAIVIIKGIYQSKNSTISWQQIKQLEKVRVTIDIFHFGFVFFRKEQAKQDFVIRS